MFVSPVFEIEPLLAFADDTFIARVGGNKQELIKDMEKSLEAITKWLRRSGLKINVTRPRSVYSLGMTNSQ